MNEIALAKGPVFNLGYVPYFYQSGKFLVYGLPNISSDSSYFSRTSRYDFSSDIVPKKGRPMGQTVEDIVNRGYFAIPRSEPEAAIISDKKHTSGLGLNDIIGQIRQRYEIYDRNIYQIELGKCYALNSIFYLEAERGGVRLSSREAYSLSKSLREFYEQERDERVRLWQDVSRLKQALPEQAQNYLTAYRKIAILEGDKGDGP
jgi:hypothetical protein